MNNATYWYYVKGRDDVTYQNRPRKKTFSVQETTEQLDFWGQTVIHYFDLIDPEGKVVRQCDYFSYCGYDRGPKLKATLRNLLLNGMGGKYGK